MPTLDEDIRDVELRLARHRGAVALLADDWVGAFRDTLVSGKSLLGVAAVGFAAGEILRPVRGGAKRRRSAASLLVGLAGLVLRARYGSPWQIAVAVVDAWRRPRPAAGAAAPQLRRPPPF
jgi:hypothetical protein